MEKIELDLSFDGLIKYAANALERGDVLECAVNLNDAISRAADRDQKRLAYELMIECYRMSSSVGAIMQAIQKEIEERVDDDYYRFDFTIRKKAYSDEETDDADFCSIRMYNDIKNLIMERRYDEAMALMTIAQPSSEMCDAVVAALNDAVSCDKNLNLDQYLFQMCALLATTMSKPEILRVMLEGGAVTHRMMVDSISVLLDEEDSNSLCLMGIAFFENNEIRIAKQFFKKTLELDPIDEDALYYMTVIKYLFTDETDSDATDYWGRYKEVFKITDPPVALTEKFFASEYVKLLVPYGTVPVQFAEKEMTAILLEITPKEDIGQEMAKRLSDYMKLAPAAMIVPVLDVLGSAENKPNLTGLYLDLLASARFNDGLKERIYFNLINGGYEGPVTILNEEKVVRFNVAKLHKRVHKAWGLMYKIVLRNAPFLDVYLPIKCGGLAYMVKKLDEIIYPDEDDIGFCLSLLVINYIKTLNMNIDFIEVLKGFNLKSEDIEEGMEKYNLDSLFIQ